MAYTSVTSKIQTIIDKLKLETVLSDYKFYIGRPFWISDKKTIDINYFPNIIFLNTTYINDTSLNVYTGKILTTLLLSEHSEEDNIFSSIETNKLSKVLDIINSTFDDVKVNLLTFDDSVQGLYTIALDLEIVFEYKN